MKDLALVEEEQSKIETQKYLFYKFKELSSSVQSSASYVQNDLSLFTKDELKFGLKVYKENMESLLSDLTIIHTETINLIDSYIEEE